MGRRVALLGAAVLLALVGTVLIYVYVRGADDRVMEEQQLVSVLVAVKQVEPGTTGREAANDSAFQLSNLPSTAVSDGALSEVQPILDQVAVTKIVPGQQLLAQLFGDPATEATTAFGPTLESGRLALSFRFEDPQRVAGFVQPGSRVAVFVDGAIDGPESARLLLPDVRVIAVGQTTLEEAEGEANGTSAQNQGALLTLNLSQPEAEKMIFSSSRGALYLALHDGQSAPAFGDGANAGNLFHSPVQG